MALEPRNIIGIIEMVPDVHHLYESVIGVLLAALVRGRTIQTADSERIFLVKICGERRRQNAYLGNLPIVLSCRMPSYRNDRRSLKMIKTHPLDIPIGRLTFIYEFRMSHRIVSELPMND